MNAWGSVDWNSTNTFEGVENRYLWQGREYDRNAGHYYFRYRTYVPEWGSFTGPDMNLANGPEGEPVGMMNYVAMGNNPLTFTDPEGLKVEFLADEGVNNSQIAEAKRLYNLALNRSINGNLTESAKLLQIIDKDKERTVYVKVQQSNFEEGGGGVANCWLPELDDKLSPAKFNEISTDYEIRRKRYREGKSVDAEIRYNPSSKVMLPDDVPQNAESLLVHEMAHAYQTITGVRPTGSNAREKQEIFAMKYENISRHAIDPTHEKIPQRKRYGGTGQEGENWAAETVLPDLKKLFEIQDKRIKAEDMTDAFIKSAIKDALGR